MRGRSGVGCCARYSARCFLRSARSGCPRRSRPAHRARGAARAPDAAARTAPRAATRRTRRRATAARALLLQNVCRGGGEVIGATGDVGVHRPRLVGAAVALAVDAPGVVAAAREPVHDRRIGLAGELQVEFRRRRHRRAVHEQDRAAARVVASRRRITTAQLLAPEEKPHVVRAHGLTVQCSLPVTSASARQAQGGCAAARGGRRGRGRTHRGQRGQKIPARLRCGSGAVH